MTWAEFQLRLIAYNRMQEDEQYKLRRLAWVTYIAPYQDPKKLRGKTEESLWKIGSGRKKPAVSDEMKDRFRQAYKQYLDKVNGKA